MADPTTIATAAATTLELGNGLVALAAAATLAGGAFATAWVQSTIGAAGVGLMAEKDGKEGQVLLFLALPETLVILGFVIAYLIISSLGGK